eukprot:458382-Rhodomonas_salina.1
MVGLISKFRLRWHPNLEFVLIALRVINFDVDFFGCGSASCGECVMRSLITDAHWCKLELPRASARSEHHRQTRCTRDAMAGADRARCVFVCVALRPHCMFPGWDWATAYFTQVSQGPRSDQMRSQSVTGEHSLSINVLKRLGASARCAKCLDLGSVVMRA